MKKIILVVFMVFASLGLNGCGSEKVQLDIMSELNVEFIGESGKGKVDVYLPTGIVMDKRNLHSIEKLLSSIQIQVDKEENLSNGDKVKVSITYDEKLYDDSGFEFTENEKTYTVEGLADYYKAEDTLTKKEYDDVLTYIMNETTLKFYENSKDEHLKKQQDGTISAYGINSKITNDAMYYAEVPENNDNVMMKLHKGGKSIIAFYKIDYVVTKDSEYYEKIKKEERQGSYYLWIEMANLTKPNKKGNREFAAFQGPECWTVTGNYIGVEYVQLRYYMVDSPKTDWDYLEAIYAKMDKKQQLAYIEKERNLTYTEMSYTK